MNCQEAKNLWGPHHDGELDTALDASIQQHLDQCPECRGFYAAQKHFETALTCSLRDNQATPALWKKEEATVRAVFAAQDTDAHARKQAEVSGLKRFINNFYSLLWPNPQFYAGLVTIWIVLLGLNWSVDATFSESASVSLSTPPQQAELAEQRRVFQTLLMANEQSQPEPRAHSPMVRPDTHKPESPKSPKAELPLHYGLGHPVAQVSRPANINHAPSEITQQICCFSLPKPWFAQVGSPALQDLADPELPSVIRVNWKS